MSFSYVKRNIYSTQHFSSRTFIHISGTLVAPILCARIHKCRKCTFCAMWTNLVKFSNKIEKLYKISKAPLMANLHFFGWTVLLVVF